VSTAKRQLGVNVSFERSGSAQLIEPAVAIHVYRVLQEALNNVARHSGADEAWVRLTLEMDRLELEVEDRGRGISPGRLPRGLGIVTMRERAGLLDGTLAFEQPPGGGTLVRLTVPLAAPDGEAATAGPPSP
jgi:signal transduction histidine kinase